jgi:hypothetical protein
MSPVTRILAAAVLSAGAVWSACAAQLAGSIPDLSGVWFPDSRASGRWPAERPFTPQAAAARAQWETVHAPIDLTRDDENLSCIPYTLPYVMTTITQYPFEIVATPQRVWLFTEVFGQVRRIDLDDVEAGDQLPSRMGRSHARWEGQVLVVETTHILPLHMGHRFPSSPAQRVVERFSLHQDAQGGRQLRVEVTVHDALIYSQPVVVRMVYKAAPAGVAPGEYICGQDLWDQHRDGSSSRIPWR